MSISTSGILGEDQVPVPVGFNTNSALKLRAHAGRALAARLAGVSPLWTAERPESSPGSL